MNVALRLAVRVWFATAVLIAVWPQPAAAQAPPPTAESFADLSRVVKPGALVIVTDDKGQRTRGTVTAVSGAALELRRYTTLLNFPADSVRAVSRVDSRRNGFTLGLLAGGVAGGYLGVEMVEFCEGFGDGEDDGCPSAIPILGGVFGLIGGGIGALVDNLVTGETRVFTRGRTTARLRVAPLTGRRSAGVRLAVTF